MNQGRWREREYVGVNGNGAELGGGIYELSRRGERGSGKTGGTGNDFAPKLQFKNSYITFYS